MKRNIHGGGAQTNINGLAFEQRTSLDDALKKAGFRVEDGNVLNAEGTLLGYSLGGHRLYSKFFAPKGIDYKDILSHKLLPDDSFIDIREKKLFIVEKKFQQVQGSVDEKLQTCDYKKWQYTKLVSPIKYSVEYVYVLNDWFRKKRYRDMLKYINDKDCHYFFNELPLKFLNLTIEKAEFTSIES